MAKLTIQDLRKIKESVSRDIESRKQRGDIRIFVHMGTCGIAAGAQAVMDTLKKEIAETKGKDIMVVASGCMGMCSSEPNVTVEIGKEQPVLYQHMNADKMRQVFKRHVLSGEVQTDFALARI